MLNKYMCIGRVGKDPEVRTTQNGKEIANLSVGISKKYKNKDGQKEERTEWVRIAIFNDSTSKFCKNYVHKGDLVYVEGELQTRKWQDKQGNDRYTTEIAVQPYGGDLQKLFSNAAAEHSEAKGNGYQPQRDIEDDIPIF